jgi:A/G-specific adenine glycosylase
MPAYTQGLMDLGATVCLARNPSCLICPVRDVCAAHGEGEPENYPVKTKKLKRTAQSLWLLRAQTKDGAVWLQKRPASGIWAGLYCLPAFESREALDDALPGAIETSEGEPFLHVLTHKDLHLHPVEAKLPRKRALPLEGDWVGAGEWPELGLPAPVRKLLSKSLDAGSSPA